MANPDYAKQVVGAIGANPQLIDELMAAGDQNSKHAVLQKHGILPAGQHGPNRQELVQQIKSLLTSGATTGTPAPGERAVEWVTAIATGAAGAMAAACSAD